MAQILGVNSELTSQLGSVEVSGVGEGRPSAFAEQVELLVKQVEESQELADQKVEDVANGYDNDLHGTMIAVERASVQLRLLMNVRDRVVEAYREVMRMGA